MSSTAPFLRPSIKEIKSIFPSAMAAGILLPDIQTGLVIHFNRRADLCSELNLTTPTAKISHAGMFDLVKQFGLVVLRNCAALSVPDEELSRLSKGADYDGNFIQDPYHYDMAPPQNQLNLPDPLYMSGICKKSSEARESDTVCAREADVKKAILKLDKSDLPIEVVDALDEMATPDYHFRLFHAAEDGARQIIKRQYPDFVEDVFALIPEGRKYRQAWLKDTWDMLLIANVHGDWLHARPTGPMLARNEAPANPLQGLYIFSR